MNAYEPILLELNLIEVILPKGEKASLTCSSVQSVGRFLTKMLLKTLVNSVFNYGAYLTPIISVLCCEFSRASYALYAVSKVMKP
jgi:hypothetical protein